MQFCKLRVCAFTVNLVVLKTLYYKYFNLHAWKWTQCRSSFWSWLYTYLIKKQFAKNKAQKSIQIIATVWEGSEMCKLPSMYSYILYNKWKTLIWFVIWFGSKVPWAVVRAKANVGQAKDITPPYTNKSKDCKLFGLSQYVSHSRSNVIWNCNNCNWKGLVLLCVIKVVSFFFGDFKPWLRCKVWNKAVLECWSKLFSNINHKPPRCSINMHVLCSVAQIFKWCSSLCLKQTVWKCQTEMC